MIATPETNTDCFRDTISAYREVRQAGEKDLPAYYSAREAYRRHQPNDPDEARNISSIISTASKKDPKWVWRGVGKSQKVYYDALVQIDVRRSYKMMTKAFTGLLLVATATCLALCTFKRMQCKKHAPNKADTNPSPHDRTTIVN